MKNLSNVRKLESSLLTVILLMVALASPTPAYASAEVVTVSQSFPIDLLLFIPCVAGGSGEWVHFTGSLHDLIHVTIDARGDFHLTEQENPQGVRGTGLATGVRYQGTGVSRFHVNGMVGFTATAVENFKIIGQGTGDNFLLHENFHITVHPDGTITALHDNFSAECK